MGLLLSITPLGFLSMFWSSMEDEVEKLLLLDPITLPLEGTNLPTPKLLGAAAKLHIFQSA